MTAHASYVNSCTGLNLKAQDVAVLLERMTLTATVDDSDASGDSIAVQVPPTRPDILHECDLMEDAAIAYGFNNLPDSFPPTSTVAQPLELSKLSDIIRIEWALAGFTEVLPLILVSINVPLAGTQCLQLPLLSANTKRTSNGLIARTVVTLPFASPTPRR